ncbi:MAG: SpoIID/LytB domain-containing protein [Candidatus Obscuribacterales bacterium]|nr:SpoIID/LytB domain-containing protein [Candidatus Obscuribacterales bacterium]
MTDSKQANSENLDRRKISVEILSSSCDLAISDDEAAGVMAALRAYLQWQDEKKKAKPKQNSDSNWVKSGRPTTPSAMPSSWRSLTLSLTLLLSSVLTATGVGAQESSREIRVGDSDRSSEISEIRQDSRPQAISLAAAKTAPPFHIRVLVKEGERFDLDIPDGAAVYSVADGALVGNLPSTTGFTASLNFKQGKQLALRGKGASDRVLSPVENVVFTPTTASAIKGSLEKLLPLEGAAAPQEMLTSSEGNSGKDKIDGSQGYIIVPPEGRQSSCLIGVGNRYYRGSMLLKPTVKNGVSQISAINLLPVEDYLLSVVPSEVPRSWPDEALKAQAVAARSYAYANLNKNQKLGFDVRDTVDDQVYLGVQSESEETNRACAETRGIVLKHNGKVISAFFHSTSGGTTEVSESVWGKPLPYLKSVYDYDDESPHFNWQREVKVQTLTNLLQQASGPQSNGSGSISPPVSPLLSDGSSRSERVLALLVVSRYPGEAKRVKNLMVVGESRIRLLSGAEARRLFNLPSTQFSVYQNGDAFIFGGRGFGHGLGLSQWGAKALADRGYNAAQILSYYYKDVTIESLPGTSLLDGLRQESSI